MLRDIPTNDQLLRYVSAINLTIMEFENERNPPSATYRYVHDCVTASHAHGIGINR